MVHAVTDSAIAGQASLERMHYTGKLQMSPELLQLERDGLLTRGSVDNGVLLSFNSPLSMTTPRCLSTPLFTSLHISQLPIQK
jgi:hypothetical protein